MPGGMNIIKWNCHGPKWRNILEVDMVIVY
jgi:hypothetical protein